MLGTAVACALNLQTSGRPRPDYGSYSNAVSDSLCDTCLHVHNHDGLLELSGSSLVAGGIASQTSSLHLGERLSCRHIGGPAEQATQQCGQLDSTGKPSQLRRHHCTLPHKQYKRAPAS